MPQPHRERTAVTEWDIDRTLPEPDDHTAVDPEVSHTAERPPPSWLSSTEQLPSRARLLKQLRRR